MPNYKVPTLPVLPGQDMFLWKEQAIETSKYMDAECRVEVTQGGHWAMLDYPDDVNRLIGVSLCRDRCGSLHSPHPTWATTASPR
jgi:pimeloyl-ACP methyl ester carboxylesterase